MTDQLARAAGDDIHVTETGEHELRPGVVDIRPPHKRAWAIIGIVAGVIVAAAIFWMPLWWGTPVPREFWRAHMWLSSWI